jgi:hypothetical protein
MSQPSEEFTITRALVEIKTLEKRIEKLISESRFITITYKGFPGDEVDTGKYTAIRDLIARRDSIKRAIIRSNGNVKVTISKRTYTVQEAIDRKASIQWEKMLLRKLQEQRSQMLNEMERHNTTVQTKLDKLLESQFGSKDTKSNKDDLASISDSYRKSNLATLVDPLQLDKEIERLQLLIEDFEKEVDFVLSESNALTKIKLTNLD